MRSRLLVLRGWPRDESGERCIEKLKYQRTDSGIDSLIDFTEFDSLSLRKVIMTMFGLISNPDDF